MILRTKEIKPFVVFLKPPPFEKIIKQRQQQQQNGVSDTDTTATTATEDDDEKSDDFTVSWKRQSLFSQINELDYNQTWKSETDTFNANLT